MPNSDSDYDPSIDRDEQIPLVTDPLVGQQNPQFMVSNYPGMVNTSTNFNFVPNNMGSGFNNPSSGSFPNLQGVQGGMMDRFNSNMMGSNLQNTNTFSSDDIVKASETGLENILPTTSNSVPMAPDTIEEGTMEMFRYEPQPVQDSKKESLADSKFIQPHRMAPMFGYTPSISEDGLGKDFSKGKEYSKEFAKKDMKMLKPVFQRKPSELVNTFKGITSSVEIREICQVDLWKKLIQKNKSLFKPFSVDSARTDSSDQNTEDKDTPRSDDIDLDKRVDSDVQDLDTKRSEADKKADSDKKRIVKDMEMSWALNIFSNLPDDLVIDLRLFEDDDLKDEEMVELKKLLRKISTYKTTVYPYQLINLPSRISKPSDPKNSFWSLDDDELLTDEEDVDNGFDQNEYEDNDELELELEFGLNGTRVKKQDKFEFDKLEEELLDDELEALVGSETKIKGGKKYNHYDSKDQHSDKDTRDKNDSTKDYRDTDKDFVDQELGFERTEEKLENRLEKNLDVSDGEKDLEIDDNDQNDNKAKQNEKEQDEWEEKEREKQKNKLDDHKIEDHLLENVDLDGEDDELGMKDNDLDLELELDLEKELEIDDELDEFNNLESELENELLNTNPALISQSDQPNFKDNEVSEDKLFGELEDTLEKRLNLYDYQHKWYQFRTGLKEKLRLTHFVEFEQNIKSQYNLDTQYYGPGNYGNEGLLLKLYSVGRTNLKLLLHYKHPEVVNMINSQIIDLNSSNVLYGSLVDEEDVTPKDELLLTMDETGEAGTKDTTKDITKETKDHSSKEKDTDKDKDGEKDLLKDDDILLTGKESEIRRQWRKRLQTMSKETRLALVNMGKSLKYIESAFMNIESSRTYDSMVEYVEVSSLFKNCDYLNILNHSFDSHYLAQNPHDVGKEDEVLNKRELMHTRVARNLVGILPVVGRSSKVQFLRFHRMDFRTSLFNTTVNYYFNLVNSLKKKKRTLDKTGDIISTGLDGMIGEEDVGVSWDVYPVLKSIINLNYKDDDLVDGMQNHCSHYFVNSSDLALVDDTKLVFLEYVEKYPLLLNNLGMTSRIDTYINSNSGESVFSQDTQDKKDEILGTPIYNSEYELFGVNQQLKPNEVQSILENTLYRAPIFYRLPQPGSSNKDTSDNLLTSNNTTNINSNTSTTNNITNNTKLEESDLDNYNNTNKNENNTNKTTTTKKTNMYDFLLIRTTTSQTSNIYESSNNHNHYDSKDQHSDKDREILRIRSFDNNVVLSTVGQCEPKVVVNNPKSKNYLEDNKLLLKAWVLKTAMTNPVTDLKRLRKVARKKFYPTIPEKEITAVLKQIENTSIFSMRPQALEKMIQTTIKPEIICSLESARAQKCRLKSRGITRLKGHEGISTVSTILQQQENHFNNSISQAKEKLKELKKAYYTRLVTLNVDEEVIKEKIKYFNIPLNEYTLYGHLPQTSSKSSVDQEYFQEKSEKSSKDKNKKQLGKKLSKDNGSLSLKVDCIEKILKLTSWNVTNDVRMVLKGSGQFSLYGLGDPSNSGVGINLLKRQIYSSVNTNVGNNIYNISIIGTSNEDLRKLSMEELSKRLQLYGVSESIIKTLPRWDQVALVRQYRDGFGDTKNLDETGNKFRIPPQEYQKQLAQIIQKQKQSLTGGYGSGPNSLNRLNSISDLMTRDELDDNLLTSNNTTNINSNTSTTNNITNNTKLEESDLDNYNNTNKNENNTNKTTNKDKEEYDAEKDLEELKLLKESFNLKKNLELVIEDDKLIPVPGLMWLRQSRKTPSEPFGNERATFIYGEENIAKVLKWRRECIERNKKYLPSEHVFGVNIGKRMCRNCGQQGHIASNPKCPLYTGDKKHDTAYMKQQMAKKGEVEVDTSDDEIITKSTALMKDTQSYIKKNINKFKTADSDTEVSDTVTYPTSITGHTKTSDVGFKSGGPGAPKKRKLGASVGSKSTGLGNAAISGVGDSGLSGLGIDTGGGVGLTGMEGMGGSSQVATHSTSEGVNKNGGAISNTDVKIINRILNTIIRENRYRPFVSRIPETIAPNYYKIIKQPMWLALLKLRMKTKYYLNISDFVKDLLLLEINCKIYNSEQSQNAWLRQMSQVLVDDLINRICHHIQNKNQVNVMKQVHSNHVTNYRNMLAKNKVIVQGDQLNNGPRQQVRVSTQQMPFDVGDGSSTDSFAQKQQEYQPYQQQQYTQEYQHLQHPHGQQPSTQHHQQRHQVKFQTFDSLEFSQTTVVDSVKSEQTELQEFSSNEMAEGDNLTYENNTDLQEYSQEDNTQSGNYEEYGDQDNMEDSLEQYDNIDNKEDNNLEYNLLDYGNEDKFDGSDVLDFENELEIGNQEGNNVDLDLDEDSNVGKILNRNKDMDESSNVD